MVIEEGETDPCKNTPQNEAILKKLRKYPLRGIIGLRLLFLIEIFFRKNFRFRSKLKISIPAKFMLEISQISRNTSRNSFDEIPNFYVRNETKCILCNIEIGVCVSSQINTNQHQ